MCGEPVFFFLCLHVGRDPCYIIYEHSSYDLPLMEILLLPALELTASFAC